MILIGTLLEDTQRVIDPGELLAELPGAETGDLAVADLVIPAGTLTDNGDDTWSYTPGAGETGPVSISYAISDGTDWVAQTASFSLSAANPGPVAVNDVYSGTPDLFMAVLNAAPIVAFNDGAGGFASATALGGDDRAIEVVTGDIDEDGDIDAVVQSADYNSSAVWLNDGRACSHPCHSPSSGPTTGGWRWRISMVTALRQIAAIPLTFWPMMPLRGHPMTP
jgi:hypothetical protein